MVVRGAKKKERWLPVPSFPGYYASSLGRIRGPSGRILKLQTSKGGYLVFCVRRNGKHTMGTAGRFVCEAFHGKAPSRKHQAAHWDGVRHNNVPSNLRWATNKENREDMKRHGTWPALNKHPRAQLSVADVREIKRIHAKFLLGSPRRGGTRKYIKRGVRQQLVEQFKVKLSSIKDILAGRSWGDV